MNNDVDIIDPAAVGLSARKLQSIQPLIENYMERQLIPGAVTLVARHGKVVHFESFGYRNVAGKKPMEQDTLFRIASMTKPITSLALMMLMEEGKVRLHDPIADYLPAYRDMQVRTDNGIVPAKRQINVRHLLTHTAGFAGEYRERNTEDYMRIAQPLNRDGTVDDFVTRLAQVPLNYEPGKEWDYSRATCVVGRLVEVLSGLSLAEFFRQRIFEPLGMDDTFFFVPPEKADRFAAAYKPGDGNRIELEDPDTEESFFRSQTSRFYIGSGGLVSTAADYLKFAEMLRRDGRIGSERLVSRKTIELMTQNHTGNKYVWLMGAGYGFGLGFGVMTDQRVSHAIVSNGSYSWGGMYCTHWWNDPVEQLYGAVFTQVRPYYHLNIRTDFQNVVTAAIED